jgi:hypothetical protein
MAYLRWRAEQAEIGRLAPGTRPWRLNLLEYFASADLRASRDPSGMEVQAAEATVMGERRPALWQHPPVQGESIVEFHVPIPTALENLRLQFAIGVREGASPSKDRLIAYRVRVDGWQAWSRAAWPDAWEQIEIPLPLLAGDMVRIAFATDGLGAHQWAWAVWGDPALVGLERGT